MNNEIIPIAADHGGFKLKSFLVEQLALNGYQIKDMGTYNDESVDYPDFIHPLAGAVNNGTYQRGIIICGSGNGTQMVANKYPNVRAALCWTEEIARLARQHNDANILSLPGRFVSKELGLSMTLIFLSTDFEGGRHLERVNKISP